MNAKEEILEGLKSSAGFFQRKTDNTPDIERALQELHTEGKIKLGDWFEDEDGIEMRGATVVKEPRP